MASKPDFTNVKVFVPLGQLGAGVRVSEVQVALERGMDVVAMDAGSTDSGAAYLATGTSKNSRSAVKADLLSLAKIYETDPDLVAIYPVESLNMIKISYPRAAPQGGVIERDLHSGQQYVYLLELELA